MKFNPDIHHRRSVRLKNYDYSQEGAYFVTICCRNKECLLGKIDNEKMQLNNCGEIIQNEWFDIANHYQNIKLDTFMVMPNHLHGIMLINVGEIVRSFKARCTRAINKTHDIDVPIWQRNYYERIVRSENELNRAREYIINNPLKWNLDEDNPTNANY